MDRAAARLPRRIRRTAKQGTGAVRPPAVGPTDAPVTVGTGRPPTRKRTAPKRRRCSSTGRPSNGSGRTEGEAVASCSAPLAVFRSNERTLVDRAPSRLTSRRRAGGANPRAAASRCRPLPAVSRRSGTSVEPEPSQWTTDPKTEQARGRDDTPFRLFLSVPRSTCGPRRNEAAGPGEPCAGRAQARRAEAPLGSCLDGARSSGGTRGERTPPGRATRRPVQHPGERAPASARPDERTNGCRCGRSALERGTRLQAARLTPEAGRRFGRPHGPTRLGPPRPRQWAGPRAAHGAGPKGAKPPSTLAAGPTETGTAPPRLSPRSPQPWPEPAPTNGASRRKVGSFPGAEGPSPECGACTVRSTRHTRSVAVSYGRGPTSTGWFDVARAEPVTTSCPGGPSSAASLDAWAVAPEKASGRRGPPSKRSLDVGRAEPVTTSCPSGPSSAASLERIRRGRASRRSSPTFAAARLDRQAGRLVGGVGRAGGSSLNGRGLFPCRSARHRDGAAPACRRAPPRG
ncbi:MAG: hypothetical protein KatS3mg117_1283 [Geminicoccaceae bacterium]|nr:MAG: hypothetical protein KatS3mg117_1283 [Geminicoccaceae bacterium]